MTRDDIIRKVREDDLQRAYERGYRAGIAAEREACAALLEANGMRCGKESLSRLILETNAAAIRARSNT